MEPSRWEQTKEVFQEAVEREGLERQAYLNEACGSDHALRVEVESLLADYESAGSFLNQLPGAQDRPLPPTFSGQAFSAKENVAGRFQITRSIGCGGMGEVYEAWDQELGKRVALKTLRPEFATDPQTVRRFKREVRLALEVTHTNVCRVYGLYHCCTHGRETPFFTMELLEGETLTRYLERKRRLAPKEALPFLRQMVVGLEAIHENGVVHRDFKPGNVMVVGEAKGVLRVVITDLGIAKSTASEQDSQGPMTRPTMVMGTPDYMAPEQLSRGKVGPPADIYALGVVIHEMLTGERPRQGVTSLRTHVPDLDERWERTIRRCLAEDPQSRPARAPEVLDALTGVPSAIEKYDTARTVPPEAAALGGRQAPRIGGLFGRMIQRRPTAGIVLGFVSLALAGWFGADFLNQQSRRPSASSSDAQAGPLVPDFGSEPKSELESMETRSGAGHIPESQREAREVRVEYESNYLLGRSYFARYDRTEDVESAIQLFNELVERDPKSAPYHAGLGEAYWHKYGHTQKTEWKDRAARSANRAFELDRESTEAHLTLGMIHQGMGRNWEAIAEFREVLNSKPLNVEARQGLGRAYQALSRFGEAEAILIESVKLAPNNWDTHRLLGYFHYQRGRYAIAIAELEKAVDLTPDNLKALNSLGYVLYMAGEFDSALKKYERTVELGKQEKVGKSSVRPYYGALANLSEIHLEEGEYKQAERYLQESIECNGNWHTPWGILGEVYYARDGPKASRPFFERAVELAKGFLDVKSGNDATIAYLAGFHARLGHREEAIDAINRPLSSENPRVLARCGEVYGMLDRTEQALTLLRKAIQRGFLPQVLRRKPGLKQLTDRDWEKLEAEVDPSRAPSRPPTL